MRGISRSHSATNRSNKNTSTVKVSKWLKRKRVIRQKISKIRSYIMDAFRNAKSIVEINKRMQAMERKVDSSLQTSNEMEVTYRKSVNFKLLLLLGLWILDKIVIVIFFKWFSAV
ncbi:hypothetical protein CL614_07715 [archaeon]|nr:hypothetical protein [archaeon]